MREGAITRDQDIQGGEPIVAGTRTPVRTVAVLFHITYPNDRARVLQALPHLSAAQIDAALRYYNEHRDEIDALIASQDLALQELALSQ